LKPTVQKRELTNRQQLHPEISSVSLGTLSRYRTKRLSEQRFQNGVCMPDTIKKQNNNGNKHVF